MAVDRKIFGGVLNTDDRPENVLPIQHIDSRNGRFYGGQNGLTFENIKGNYLITNSSLPTGTNECIGSFYDSVNRRIIWFNYNSNGRNGIYQLTIQTGAVTPIFICFTNSSTDILNFSLDYPVHSAALVYRTEGDGDLLYWTDGLNRPKYINLDTVSSLSPFTDSMIFAAKLPPLVPASSVTYVNDAAYFYNTVFDQLFQFSYRWTYKSLEKSTFAPFSITPIPAAIFPPISITTNTQNAIDLVVPSASDSDFISIEIVARQWLGAAWSDFFLIQTVTATDVGLPLPFNYTFRFYNNGSYSPVSVDETDLYFDWLPDKANTLELLNGNVIIYGGLTEGYEPLTRQQVDVQLTTTTVAASPYPFITKSWMWSQYQRLGIQYYDRFGKPIGGVISFLADPSIDTNNFDVTTLPYSGETLLAINIPSITGTINHIPPQDAYSYQWVRQDLTPKSFVQWVTNDLQTDTDYMYFCIQSLIQANSTTGFLTSYEFTPGDRLRVIGAYNSTQNVSQVIGQLDFQIVEIVQRVMGGGNPAQNGAFLKVVKPAPAPAYTANMLIHIYTPPTTESIFYEWGQRYGFTTILGIKYHNGGTQNQTASQPAITTWTEGDVYLKPRTIYPTLGTTGVVGVMDRRFNDFSNSATNSNGRGWLIDPNANEEYNGVLVRWGGKYQAGTNINNLNRFRPVDFDEADRSKGDLRRFKARDRILRAFQDRGVGQWGIYARFIQNNEGVPELVTTNEIITTNNIQYYQGTYGLGGYPTNLCSTAIADYFADITTGREIRLSGDGITDLGLLYKGQFTLPSFVTPYNKQLLRSNSSIAKVMKYWDSFENEAHTVLQAGTGNGTVTTDKNYSFNETRNAFCCNDYDENPEWALSADDVVYLWKEGQIYKRSDLVPRCFFFGVQYDASITVVFNPNVGQKKTWESVAEVASDTWEVTLAYSDVYTYTGQRQETNLIPQEFVKLEQMPSTSWKRDAHSPGGKWNGQVMKGQYLVAKFQKTAASNSITLTQIQVRFVDSPLNVS